LLICYIYKHEQYPNVVLNPSSIVLKNIFFTQQQHVRYGNGREVASVHINQSFTSNHLSPVVKSACRELGYCSSSCRHSTWPWLAASCRAVQPKLSLVFTFTPAHRPRSRYVFKGRQTYKMKIPYHDIFWIRARQF